MEGCTRHSKHGKLHSMGLFLQLAGKRGRRALLAWTMCGRYVSPHLYRQLGVSSRFDACRNGPGGLRAFQSGRLDPWGTSTSDAWHRAVERQTRDPYGPGRPGYGAGPLGPDDDDELGRSEWDPSRRVPGWTPPGRWGHARLRAVWTKGLTAVIQEPLRTRGCTCGALRKGRCFLGDINMR